MPSTIYIDFEKLHFTYHCHHWFPALHKQYHCKLQTWLPLRASFCVGFSLPSGKSAYPSWIHLERSNMSLEYWVKMYFIVQKGMP